jgi:hypothetical protein
MARVLLTILLFVTGKAFSQRRDDPRFWLKPKDKIKIDSIANVIDKIGGFISKIDSVRVVDEFNPNQTKGFFVTRLYKDRKAGLAKVIVSAIDQPERTFYYKDSFLLKAELGPTYSKMIRYYSKEINNSPSFVRLQLGKLYPQTRQYWDELDFGLLYVKELSVL